MQGGAGRRFDARIGRRSLVPSPANYLSRTEGLAGADLISETIRYGTEVNL